MKRMEWITSDGGPLICVEKRLKDLWGGMDRLTVVPQCDAQNDYDRACQCRLLLNSIPLENGNALVFGDEPFSTAFWQVADDALRVVRIQYTEPSTEIGDLLSSMNESKLEVAADNIEFSLNSSDLVLFDSVEDGIGDFTSLAHEISPGKYAISTKVYEPDSLHSLYIHEFVKISDI